MRPSDLARPTTQLLSTATATATAVAADAGGLVLGAASEALGRARGGRALHRQGVVRQGHLAIDQPGQTGLLLLDRTGDHAVTCRISRALTPAGPDVIGLGLRIHRAGPLGGPADLLFYSAGEGRLTRFLPALRTGAQAGPLCTVLPLRANQGDLLLSLHPDSDVEFRMRFATPRGRWQECGLLRLSPADEPNDVDPFNPITHPLLGAGTPEWVRALRAPSLRATERTARLGP